MRVLAGRPGTAYPRSGAGAAGRRRAVSTLLRLVGALVVLAGPAVALVATAPAASASSAQASRLDWAHDFEDSLGAPQGGNNDAVLTGWMLAEGGGTFTSPVYNNVSKYNPLNTTLNEPGSYSINNLGGGHGVQAYSSWTLGVTANHDAIAVNAYGYPAIVADLRANAPIATTANDIGASSWCSPNKCYGGAGAPSIVSLASGGSSGTQLANPSGSASYAQCNILSYHEGGTARNTAGDYLFLNASCNGAIVGGTSPQYLVYSYTSHNYPSGTTTTSYNAGTNWYGGATASSLTAQGSQKYQGGEGGLIDCQSCTNDYGYTLTNIQIMQGGSLHPVTYTVITGTDSNGTSRAAVYPVYPLNYYPGGVAGTPSLPSPPAPSTSSPGGTGPGGISYPTVGTPLCSRTMPQAQTSPVNFLGGIAKTSGVTYSYSWAWGDGTTAGTNFNDSHTYVATQPAGGWTAVLTVTATGDGVTYSGTATSTCSLRVDFANPDQSTPGGNNGSGSDSSNCPSGWGWLNPAALVNLAPCLIVPSSNTISSIQGLGDQAKTTVPFSYITDLATFMPNAISQIAGGMTATNTGGCLLGNSNGASNHGHPIHGFGGASTYPSPFQGSSSVPGAGTSSSGTLCLTTEAAALGLPISTLRTVLLMALLIGFGFGLWRLIGRTIG